MMKNSILLEEMESILIAPPTYLKSVYLDLGMDYIEFVYIQENRGEIVSPKQEILSPKEERMNVSDLNTTLDVTGSPLKVNLCGNETLNELNNDTSHYCPEVETGHCPVNIKLARSYLNQHVKTHMFHEVPVFVLCDGNNPQKTVLIGVHRTKKMVFTCLLNVVGLYPVDHEKISLESMQKSHIVSARVRDLKINYLTHFKYYTHGNHLRNIENIHDSKHFGSICIEMSCNEICDLQLPRNLRQMKKKMILQVVIGHELSRVYFLWQDLCLLQNYVDISSRIEGGVKGNTELSATPIPFSDIRNTVDDLVSSMTSLRRQTKLIFDLKNIRNHNILDKLWNILKYCENVSALRNAFHHFFEKLAACDIKIHEVDNNSNVATIVNGILDGKLAVPTLTYRQALEFLFEVGAEKLMNDYRVIIKQFHLISDNVISDSAISVEWKKLYKKLPLTHEKEKETTSEIHNISKLSYLGRLHVAVEMIYLVKDQVSIPQGTLDEICKCVYMNYIRKEALNTSSKSQMDYLHEFHVDIDSVNEDIIRKELPVSWTMQMKSTVKKTEIITVYHLSQNPIIPKKIYDGYDIENLGDEMAYYAYKFTGQKECN